MAFGPSKPSTTYPRLCSKGIISNWGPPTRGVFVIPSKAISILKRATGVNSKWWSGEPSFYHFPFTCLRHTNSGKFAGINCAPKPHPKFLQCPEVGGSTKCCLHKVAADNTETCSSLSKFYDTSNLRILHGDGETICSDKFAPPQVTFVSFVYKYT